MELKIKTAMEAVKKFLKVGERTKNWKKKSIQTFVDTTNAELSNVA